VNVEPPECPSQIADYAAQAVQYVERSVGLTLEYDSDTLPLLDHYLRTVPADKEETALLAAGAGGAYFGEVVRRRIGGHWNITSEDPGTWRLILPGGASFLPVCLALSVVLRADQGPADPAFEVPPRMLPVLEATLEAMGAVTEDEYYSLGGRLDVLEHLQSVLLAAAAEAAKKQELI